MLNCFCCGFVGHTKQRAWLDSFRQFDNEMECPTNRKTEREREKASSTPRRSNQKNEHVMNDCNIALCEPLTIIHIIHIIGHLRFQIA